MPNLDQVLRIANEALESAELSVCTRIASIADGDTMNPTVIGYAPSPRYVIKVSFRHPHTLGEQLRTANWFKENTELPVPRHLCHSTSQQRLPLMIMEWMPGEQLRLAMPALKGDDATRVAREWGRSMALLHTAQVPEDLLNSSQEAAMNDLKSLDRQWHRSALETIDRLGGDPPWTPGLRQEVRAYLFLRRFAGR